MFRCARRSVSSVAERGVWTFGRLMRDLAPTPGCAALLNLFQNWLTDQMVNGFIVPRGRRFSLLDI